MQVGQGIKVLILQVERMERVGQCVGQWYSIDPFLSEEHGQNADGHGGILTRCGGVLLVTMKGSVVDPTWNTSDDVWYNDNSLTPSLGLVS